MKMSLVAVKPNRSIDFPVECNDKKPKCEVNDHVRISKYHKVVHQIGRKKLKILLNGDMR